ncbi:MAG TPA: hypothetical protein VGR16_13190 [Thermomicrobiales bacterium]|nr:hypothetical protein [Thermomicrobiales bacterium]
MYAVALTIQAVEPVAVETNELNLLFALLVIAVLSVGLSALFSSSVSRGGGIWVNAGVTVLLFVGLGYYVLTYHYLEHGYFLVNFV